MDEEQFAFPLTIAWILDKIKINLAIIPLQLSADMH